MGYKNVHSRFFVLILIGHLKVQNYGALDVALVQNYNG